MLTTSILFFSSLFPCLPITQFFSLSSPLSFYLFVYYCCTSLIFLPPFHPTLHSSVPPIPLSHLSYPPCGLPFLPPLSLPRCPTYLKSFLSDHLSFPPGLFLASLLIFTLCSFLIFVLRHSLPTPCLFLVPFVPSILFILRLVFLPNFHLFLPKLCPSFSILVLANNISSLHSHLPCVPDVPFYPFL